ncbi:uncharacterized protein LOC118372349 isoform X1 [Oncorhynchus keta]|uniref:uncharacterized protein LOC118372349 isoform X1 n=1 Tax=Oncorhynchus keta TaxID=8018 RepID=UPI00227CAE58|nr:uncharacterized protein LOC118372349 isoform X1 [Oncorhynchus keta]
MNSNRKEDMEISSHYRQLLRELSEQRQHGILCDACVIVEGKIFKAHKNVLLGSSRYFKTLYCQVKKGAEPHHQTTVTHLDIVTATGFKAILDFMYSAHLALTSKNVIEVMSAASYLQMTDIVQACHGFIRAALDISLRSELADVEMGAAAGAGIGGGGVASEALVSIISGRSSSPWLGRHTSPANSSGDSAIASCHEGSGSTYGKEDQEPPKSHESQEDGGHDSQPAWPHSYRPITVKEEQVSPSSVSHPRDGPNMGAGTQGDQGGGGEGPWQPSGSGRRKNRKNKDTVRHITQQAEGDRDSRAGSPLPSMMGVTGWSYNGKDIPGADVTEPNSSDSRGERLDFFLKQEESLAASEANFLGASGESDEAGGGTGGRTTPLVANLRAALMSKNSLLSLRAEMLGDDNPLLFEYLPKGGHSLSRLHNNHHNQQHLHSPTLQPGATAGAAGSTFDSKQGAASSSYSASSPLLLPPPLPPPQPSPRRLPTAPPQPSEARPLMAPGLRPGGPRSALHSHSVELAMDEEEALKGPEPCSPPPEVDTRDENDSNQGYNKVLEHGPSPMEGDQMAEERHGVSRVEVLEGGGRGALLGPAWPQELACSLCKRLFSSLEQLKKHEYRHTLSLMALSLDWPDPQGPQANHHHNQTHAFSQGPIPSQSLYRLPVGESFPARYLCSQCPATFTLKSNADRHEKTIHFKRKLMQCTYCLKHFRDRTDLHRHLSSVHSRERGHSCPACAKAFSTQKNLATHVKVCCQVGVGVGSWRRVGMGVGQGGVAEQLWGLHHERKVDAHSNHNSHHHHVNVVD